jgi:hypothetical protein
MSGKTVRGRDWALLYDKREKRGRWRSQSKGVLLGMPHRAEAGVPYLCLCLCLLMKGGERQKPCPYVLRKAEMVRVGVRWEWG